MVKELKEAGLAHQQAFAVTQVLGAARNVSLPTHVSACDRWSVPWLQALTAAVVKAAIHVSRLGSSPTTPQQLAVKVQLCADAARPHYILSHATTRMRLNVTHYDKLARMYRARLRQYGLPSGDEALMHSRIFNVLMRYETLSGTSSGYQGALPDATFQAMQNMFGVSHECFASPLNCYYGSFCRYVMMLVLLC